MKQTAILIFVTLFLSADILAGAGTFPQGDSVKLLRDKMKFKTGRTIESGAVNPTAVATPGDQGSLFTNDTGVYFKGDDGITTNWVLLTPFGIPIMAKGSILTSNGAANGEFTACADGEALEYDAAEVSGVKCVTVSGANQFIYTEYHNFGGTGSGYSTRLMKTNSIPSPDESNYDIPLDSTDILIKKEGYLNIKLHSLGTTTATSIKYSYSVEVYDSLDSLVHSVSSGTQDYPSAQGGEVTIRNILEDKYVQPDYYLNISFTQLTSGSGSSSSTKEFTIKVN